jgi:hypothetical protein
MSEKPLFDLETLIKKAFKNSSSMPARESGSEGLELQTKPLKVKESIIDDVQLKRNERMMGKG